MIDIRKLNRSALQAFIESSDFLKLPFLPISRHRAVSHMNNPRATEKDTLLLLAYSDDELVGYLGVLPDWIFDKTGKKHTCGWLSCMWIDVSQRGKGISKKLVGEALDAYDQKILVTEFTYPAQRLYDKIGAFQDLQKIQGIRLYVRSDLNKLLPPKGPKYASFTRLWRSLDRAINLLLDRRFSIAGRKSSHHIAYPEKIDAETQQFTAQFKEKELFRRTVQEWNWILSHPWIKEQSVPDIESEKYHFSSIAKRFRFVPTKLYDDDRNLIAFLIFAIRDDALKVPYCYFKSRAAEEVKSCIEEHIMQWKISTCTIFHQALVRLFAEDKGVALHARKMHRHYIIGKVFTQFQADHSYAIQDGDADCAFT